VLAALYPVIKGYLLPCAPFGIFRVNVICLAARAAIGVGGKLPQGFQIVALDNGICHAVTISSKRVGIMEYSFVSVGNLSMKNIRSLRYTLR